MENNTELKNVSPSEKDDLLNQLQKINEILDGKDNPEVAKRITELEIKKLEFDERIKILKVELSELESNSMELMSQIQNLSGKGIQKILDTIKKQRWFYFKDKPKVIFDKSTAYLWPNPQYWDMKQYSLEELMRTDFKIKFRDFFDHFDDWNIPSQNHCLDIEGYPISTYWINQTNDTNRSNIFGSIFRCSADKNGNIEGFNLLKPVRISSVLLVNTTLNPYKDLKEFYNNTKHDNKIYSENEKAQMVLDIFVNNKLRPIFEEDDITRLYNNIFIERDKLVKLIQEKNKQL